jgi:hypothetical protein
VLAEGVRAAGRTLICGPTNVGKTRRTFTALQRWVEENGAEGVVVFEFAPELVRDGTLIGGRLSRFRALPDGVWEGVLDAHAPRSEGETPLDAVRLAAKNAAGAMQLVAAARREFPEPHAVFVNDATIAFGHPDAALDHTLDYWGRADCVVVNAFSGDELGTDDPVTEAERASLAALRGWADAVVRLE